MWSRQLQVDGSDLCRIGRHNASSAATWYIQSTDPKNASLVGNEAKILSANWNSLFRARIWMVRLRAHSHEESSLDFPRPSLRTRSKYAIGTRSSHQVHGAASDKRRNGVLHPALHQLARCAARRRSGNPPRQGLCARLPSMLKTIPRPSPAT